MKIIKYLLLLIILAIIGLSVFVATQKSDFYTSKSTFIKVDKTVVYTYLNDYKNWEDWGSWKEDDPEIQFIYPDLTAGLGASFTKKGVNGLEITTTTFTKENDSIVQKINGNGVVYASFITFKDSIGGTKLTWTSKGSVNFKTKVLAAFTGGINHFMGSIFERSLYNLNAILNKEINIFDVSVKGIIKKKGGFYLKQTVICAKQDFQNKLQIFLPRMIYFFKNNDLKMNGKPFVIYEKKESDSLQFSVCAPLFEEVFISENSDVQTGFLEPFYAVKTTLTGDYSHLSEAKKKAIQYLDNNRLVYNTTQNEVDIFTINGTDIKNPSKWKTDILTPIVYKFEIPKPIKIIAPEVNNQEKQTIIPDKI